MTALELVKLLPLMERTAGRTEVAEKFFVHVDVTEEFPFLVTRLAAALRRCASGFPLR